MSIVFPLCYIQITVPMYHSVCISTEGSRSLRTGKKEGIVNIVVAC